jgi:hypothetical protein
LQIIPTSNGEILKFKSNSNPAFLGTNKINIGDKYLWLTADVKPTAINSKTIKINALSNPINLAFLESPIITTNLADLAGIQTITDVPLTISTVATPAANIYQGENGNPMYIFKVDAPTTTATITGMRINTLGTYTGNSFLGTDLRGFLLYYNSVNDFSTATYLQGNWYNPYCCLSTVQAFTGSVAPRAVPVTIPAGQSGYFYLIPMINTTAIPAHTIKVDGSANPVALELLNGVIPIITNNQTDIAGTQTIISTTVLPAPIISSNSTTFCNGNTPSGVTLTGTGCPSSSKTAWFLGTNSTAFASTNGSIIVTPTTNSIYKVSCVGTGFSSGISLPITINSVFIGQPSILNATPNTFVVAGNPVILNDPFCSFYGSSTVWEDLSTLNPRTVYPINTSVFSVRCSNGPCISTTQRSITITVTCPLALILASTADDITSGIVRKIASTSSGGNISATNKINGPSNVSYTARVIDLNPGFLASSSAVFKAEPGGCL